MEQIKKYIRGNKERGHEVIAELEKLGGKIKIEVGGNNANNIYFIDDYGGIVFVDENTFFGQLIVTHPDWEEIELSKDKYPKTYEECCELLSLGENGRLYTKGYKANLIQNFQKLLICRDAYWKIAGEKMGLGKPWERCDTKNKYIIRRVGDEILKSNNISCVLSFPTPEMRDAFYDNFKELINECKELL